MELVLESLAKTGTELSVVSGTFRRGITGHLMDKRLALKFQGLKDGHSDFQFYVPGQIELTEKNQELVRNYLKDYEPKKQLDQIEALLEEFRSVMEKHFSVSDILIKVRDKNNDVIPSIR